ncbi:MAG: hypothetical protein QUS08_01970 [Methanothrix sp.]|nr:hypothetical protein [Methanothrix sp.]
MRTAIYAALLCLVLLTTVPAVAQFGSKVQTGDPDVGLPLSAFAFVGGPSPQAASWLAYWDIGTTPNFYDDQDVAYLQFGTVFPRIVKANNIRLTGWGPYPAGSYVADGDSDIGQAVIPAPFPALPAGAFTGFRYMDVSGGPGYDLGDPVYLKTQLPAAPTTGTNDIRITANGIFPAGSRVSLNDPDGNKPLTPFKAWYPAAGGPVIASIAGPVAQLAFYNANGNSIGALAIYDTGDVVYLDVQPLNEVSPNDIRLY